MPSVGFPGNRLRNRDLHAGFFRTTHGTHTCKEGAGADEIQKMNVVTTEIATDSTRCQIGAEAEIY